MLLKRISCLLLIQLSILANKVNFEIRNNTNQTIYYSVTEQGVNVLETEIKELSPKSSDSDVLDFTKYPQIYLLPNNSTGTNGKVYTLKASPSIGSKTMFATIEKEGSNVVLKPNPGILQSGSLEVDASATLNIPEVGSLDATITGELSVANPTLMGSVSNFNYKNFNLSSMSLLFKPREGKYEFVGIGKYKDLEASVALKRSQNELSLSGQFNKEFKPFKDITLLKKWDVAITSGAFELAKKQLQNKASPIYSLSINGDAKISGYTFNTGVILPLGAGPIAVFIDAPVNWKIGDTFKLPEVFNKLELSNAKAVLASEELKDAKGNNIPAGLTVQADFQDYKVTKDKGIKSLVGSAKASVALTIPEELSKAQAVVKFSGEIPHLPKNIKNTTLELDITAKPSAKLLFDLQVDLVKGQDPVTFKFGPELSGEGTVVITGEMQGCYKDAFKIPGFNICDVTLDLGVDIKALIDSPEFPGKFGLGGAFDLASDKRLILKGSFDAGDPKNTYMIGDFKGELSLQDVANVCQKLLNNVPKLAPGKKVQLDNLPNISIKDIQYVCIPVGLGTVSVGSVTYEPGMTMKGTLNVLGHETSLQFVMGYSGFIFDAFFQTLNIGKFITITGGKNKAPGQTKDGVYCSVAATLNEQHVYFSGMIKVANVLESETEITLSLRDGFKLHTDTKLFGDKFTGTLDAQTKGDWQHPDFVVDIVFHNELQDYIANAITSGLKDVQREINKTAREANMKFHEEKAKLEKQRQDATATIEKAKKDANKNLDDAKSKLQSVKREYDDAVRQWNSFSDWEKAYRWVDVGSKIAGLKVAYETANAAVDKLARSVVNWTLSASVIGAQGTLNATKDVVEISRQAAWAYIKGGGVVLDQSGKFVAEDIVKGFAIKDLKFHGSLQEIVDGTLPRLDMTVTIFGKDDKITVAIEFKDLSNSVKKIANRVIDDIKRTLKIS